MEKRGILNVKSQAWGIDLAIALVIFTFGILIFFFYTVNRPNEAKENIDSLSYDGGAIASAVLSKGYPDNWNASNIVTLGILSDNKINETKLEYFYNLSTEDYNRTRALFNTRFEYYISFSQNVSIGGLEVEGIGNEPNNEKNLIRITRFTIYKNKPTTVYFDIWE